MDNRLVVLSAADLRGMIAEAVAAAVAPAKGRHGWLTTKRAERVSGISASTLRRMAATGGIPANAMYQRPARRGHRAGWLRISAAWAAAQRGAHG